MFDFCNGCTSHHELTVEAKRAHCVVYHFVRRCIFQVQMCESMCDEGQKQRNMTGLKHTVCIFSLP